jgi:GT2 family glycosyltransferase
MDYQESDFSECIGEMILYTLGKNLCEIDLKYLKGSLVYDARNQLVKYAREKGGYDFVLWLDSDMTFEPDLLEKLLEDIEGRQAVTGLCFGRRPPFNPCIYKELDVKTEGKLITPYRTIYDDYPRDSVFEVEACGFACVLMRMDMLEAMGIYGVPFFPVAGLGEDLTFCWRARKLDIKFHCDSRLKIGHIMRISVDEGFRDQMLGIGSAKG